MRIVNNNVTTLDQDLTRLQVTGDRLRVEHGKGVRYLLLGMLWKRSAFGKC